MKPSRAAIAIMVLLAAGPPAMAQEIAASEYEDRRERLLRTFADGIVLLHARSSPASLGEPFFKQDSAFFYFTGLANQPAAILSLFVKVSGSDRARWGQVPSNEHYPGVAFLDELKPFPSPSSNLLDARRSLCVSAGGM